MKPEKWDSIPATSCEARFYLESFSGCIPRSLLRVAGLLPCCPNTPQLAAGIFYCIAEKGRAGWQKALGYTRRAKVEAAIGRWKQVIGDGLRSRMDERRTTEVNVAVHVLNRMLELGRPSYALLSDPKRGVGVAAPTP